MPATLRVRLHGFENRERAVEVEPPVTPRNLLRTLNVPREGALVFVNGDPVPDDAELDTDDDIRVVRTVSGGWR